MTDEQPNDLVTMTADIVASYVANNLVDTAEVVGLIGSIHSALQGLGQSAEPATVVETPKGAVSARKSLANASHILSMIDGKPYSVLTRHLKRHGYTPASYRETFGLPADYPLVAPDYAAKRRSISLAIGFGRKKVVLDPAPVPARKRGRPKKADA